MTDRLLRVYQRMTNTDESANGQSGAVLQVHQVSGTQRGEPLNP
jgi:hypothetical protein